MKPRKPKSGAGNAKRERTLVTPEGLAIPISIASRGSRFGALVIDWLIIITVMTLIRMLIGYASAGAMNEGVNTANEAVSGAAEFLVVVQLILLFLAWYGYFLVQELGPRGATLGKRAVGIRVASRSGGRLPPEAIIARNLLRDVEIFFPLVFILVALIMNSMDMDTGNMIWAAIGWLLIFALFPFFNKDALRAGDVIAGTWVVDSPRTKLADTLSTQGAAAKGSSDVTGARYEFGEAELSIYGERELQTLEKMLRDAKPEALTTVHATICNKIGWDPGAGDERAFLEAFYGQLRAKLEGDMRFGKRKADKFS
ncbi:RDD family protein [Erythrobacter sp. MTPC3]|uniref:RDD family protein n=1 Tax=Erythrobacter sp. MTPC3 TaxID=3056564 RepID=UPI0036F31216